jgi:pheromone alpha factor receptor
MDQFDPTSQRFIIIGNDGKTEILVSMSEVDAVYKEYISVSINYASQLGAAFAMLLVVLTLTPPGKRVRLTTCAHILALSICVIRSTLLCTYFTSNWTEFYARFSGDYSVIQTGDFHRSVATETISLIFFIAVQLVLILQAWAMVRLWDDVWKWLAVGLSAGISLSAVSFRFAYCVIQNKAILSIEPAIALEWVAYYTTVLAAVSIFWFCAIFNVRLVSHLASRRNILPRRKGLGPMEVLVMTNGLLMVVPGKPT